MHTFQEWIIVTTSGSSCLCENAKMCLVLDGQVKGLNKVWEILCKHRRRQFRLPESERRLPYALPGTVLGSYNDAL